MEEKQLEIESENESSMEFSLYGVIKRLIDVVCSFMGVIVLSPLFIIIAIIIKTNSKGPVFFSQKRVGKNGKEFDMYKFRSMVVNAEELKEKLAAKNEMSGPMFKMKDDPRVTKVGKFIRKTSIDELPQLWNVLKGDMSLVGPRPSLPKEVAQFESWMYKRLEVKPGLTCSFMGVIVLSPLFIIIAIIIKTNSKGPVFFSQKRVGKNGKEFDMYKFRSMVVNAEELKEKLAAKNEMSGPMFKMKDDPRVTKVGKFIRKTSIDELPQLWNVLKGDMSLVGPRPSLPKEVAQFESWMYKRLEVKPGLTCYWQVSGRNNIDFEDWMKLDIRYVEERSLFVDIKLILKTIFVLFGDKNAS